MKAAAVLGPVEGMKLLFAREALIVLGPRTEGVYLGDKQELKKYGLLTNCDSVICFCCFR